MLVPPARAVTDAVALAAVRQAKATWLSGCWYIIA